MTTSPRKYPRNVWVLTPAFKPKEITVISAYSSWNYADYGDMAAGGKRYAVENMHATLADAIAAGRAALVKAQADTDKRQETINKKARALDKAEASK